MTSQRAGDSGGVWPWDKGAFLVLSSLATCSLGFGFGLALALLPSPLLSVVIADPPPLLSAPRLCLFHSWSYLGKRAPFQLPVLEVSWLFFPLSPEDSGASPGVLLQRSGYVGGFVSFAPCGAGEQPIKGFSDTQEAPRVTEQSAHIFTVGIC